MPILWKTSTEGLNGSKRLLFNLRWDASPSRRVPRPTNGRCRSRQYTVGIHERHIRPETLHAGCAIGRLFSRGSRARTLEIAGLSDLAYLESDLGCEPAPNVVHTLRIPQIVPSQLLQLLVRFLGNVALLSMRAGLSSANVSMLPSGAGTRSKRSGLACTVDAR